MKAKDNQIFNYSKEKKTYPQHTMTLTKSFSKTKASKNYLISSSVKKKSIKVKS